VRHDTSEWVHSTHSKNKIAQPTRSKSSIDMTRSDETWQKFSNFSSLLHQLLKITKTLTFEDIEITLSIAHKKKFFKVSNIFISCVKLSIELPFQFFTISP